MITNQKRIRMKWVINHCMGILKELVAEFDLELHIVFVPSEKN